MFLSLKIALRFSRGQQRNNRISLMFIISIVGISLGVVVLIIGLSAMNGFEYELNHRILAVVPHGEIEAVNPPFINFHKVLQCVKEVPGIVAVAPYIKFTGLITYSDKLQAIQIKGVDPDQELQLSSLPFFIQNSIWQSFKASQQQIIIGKGVADNLKINLGDWLTIMIPNSNLKNKLLRPKYIRLRVHGILELNSQLDHSLALVPLIDAQYYLDIGHEIWGIGIKVNEVFRADQIVHNAGLVTNTFVYVRSWISTYGYIYRDIQMIRVIMYLTMLLVICVACFNIVSTLIMAVKNKSIDVMILRTIGGTTQFIYIIFIWYGLLTGLIGSLIGGCIGVLIALNLTKLVSIFEYFLNYQIFLSDIYFIDFIPIKLKWWDVANVLLMVLLLSLLSSWYPARRASQIKLIKVVNNQ